MTLIQLSKPVCQIRERHGFQPHWRTVFIYQCDQGHTVRVFANHFIGKKPVPGVGAITCPFCEWKEENG